MIYLVDKSVLVRRHLAPVNGALRSRLSALAVCDATALEVGWSARDSNHYAAMMRDLDEYRLLTTAAQCWSTARRWQQALVSRGHHRGPGVADLVIAATAHHHSATVLHYDADFDAIAAISPDVRTEWVVPRGSVA